jgi:BirA family transcriptional regulator, biotin operon repressor / biotin---[acetyl-CoA-carboxylase] ligase
MSPKQKILNLLNQADDVVSGETLSAELGVSRVSVWKHIKGLVQSGVPIVSSPKGYHLTRDADTLFPWEFGEWQDRIHYFQETASTMDEAMVLARKRCPDFTVVVAQRQTRGRGRLQRTWLSADGGLYFSIVIRPEIPIVLTGLVNLAAAIDMADLLRTRYRVAARLKWPNDILVGDKKLCGVLSQMDAEGGRVAYMTIGIGLNVNNAPQTDEPQAISLQALLHRQVPRREVLTAFLEVFKKRMASFDPDAVIEQWKAGNITLGRKVRIVTTKAVVKGTAVDVDSHGGLVLQMADGTRRTVMVGDCFHT